MKLVILICMMMLSGCGWYRDCTNSRSYKLNTEISSSVGHPLIQSGCFEAMYEPRGFNRILWQRTPVKDDQYGPHVEKELIYSGRDGNTLHIAYREYSFNYENVQMARPAFYQQLFYDMGASKSIVFQDWVIDVIESSNQQIRFKVVKEPVRVEPFILNPAAI